MKKIAIICLALLTICLTPSFSQLKFTSTGYLGIGTSSPLSQFSLGSDGHSSYTAHIYSSNTSITGGLRVNHYPNTGNYNYGIINQIGNNSNGWKITGIYTAAYKASNTDNIYTYGIAAYAGRGQNGLNYAVMGKLVGTRDGAGIFGCDSENAETYIDGDYAGFFSGDVHIEGDLTVDGTYPSSDINLKKDIRSIEDDVISKLLQLQVIKYKLKHPSELGELGDTIDMNQVTRELESEKYTKDRIGLIAQELQTTFPEVIKEGNDGYLRVNYDQLIPVLVKAINLQQQQIAALETRFFDQKSSKESQSFTTSSNESISIFAKGATLQQNIPNPFYENTIIKYTIPKIESYAMINVYDLQGGQVRSFNIAHIGDGEITIPASELNPGLFIYNLIVDGVEVTSRRMVLTE